MRNGRIMHRWVLFALVLSLLYPEPTFACPVHALLSRTPTRSIVTSADHFEESAKPKDFRFVNRQGNRVGWVLDWPERFETLDPIRIAIESQLGRGKTVNTVLYPFSGFDSGTPFRIFPNALWVVGIDKNPASLSVPLPLLKYAPQPYFPWTNHEDVRDSDLLPLLLGSLKGALPKFRLVQVRLDITERPDSRNTVDAEIQFDQGPGTPVQRYFHLHETVALGPNGAIPSRLQSLGTFGIDAVIVKAGMMALEAPKANRPRPFRNWILSTLQERSGLLIEGYSYDAAGSGWEVTGFEALGKNLILTEIPYSYADKVRITRLRRSRQP